MIRYSLPLMQVAILRLAMLLSCMAAVACKRTPVVDAVLAPATHSFEKEVPTILLRNGDLLLPLVARVEEISILPDHPPIGPPAEFTILIFVKRDDQKSYQLVLYGASEAEMARAKSLVLGKMYRFPDAVVEPAQKHVTP